METDSENSDFIYPTLHKMCAYEFLLASKICHACLVA